jgi:hypothetical protein
MRFSPRKFGIENALNRDRPLTLPPTRNVTAINKAGEGKPSNTEMVML